MQPASDLTTSMVLTPCAAQLRAGFTWLRFAPALEQEYLQAQLQTLRVRMFWTSVLALAIWGGFWLFDQWRIPPFARDTLAAEVALRLQDVRLAVAAALVLMGLCAWRKPRSPWLQAAFTALSALLVCGTAYSVYAYKLMGLPDESSVLVLVMLGVFLPLGLSVRSQLLVAVLYVAAVEAMALSAPLPEVREAMLRSGVVLMISLCVLAFGAYWREYLQREQFLLRGDMHWMAMRDALTGLFNRRMFAQQLQMTMRQAQREQRPLALLLIDVDHFKRYNDHHGHPAGDRVLQALAAVFESMAARPLDMAVRLGGEEFALLRYDCDATHAQQTGDALVAAVAELALAHAHSPLARVVTVSVGYALLLPGERPEDLYTRADAALYAAKAAGRNRCSAAPSAPAAGLSP